MKAWHFLREDKRLGYGDGRLVRVGHTLRCDPDRIALCEYGFHGSVKALDAAARAAAWAAARAAQNRKLTRMLNREMAA
jgi:hypothetical protein